MFKGYEEARVALTALLFTAPCCVIIGVEYGVFMHGEIKKVSSSMLSTIIVERRMPTKDWHVCGARDHVSMPGK